MRIFVYISENDPDILGFTSDETGSNLPHDLGPWGREEVPGIVILDTPGDPIAEAVRRSGFHLVIEHSVH
jgi:hypothetical protein